MRCWTPNKRESAGAPPRPRLAYRVGVTGHRTLSSANRSELRDGVATLLKHIRDTVREIGKQHAAVYADEGAATFVVISPLARGADQLVARQAVSLGYALDAPTPYDLTEADPDMADPDSPAGRLYQSARAHFVLDGLRGDVQSYVEVGQRVVANSDLLIAIWDGRVAAGPGGTAEIVKLAREREVPVFHFHTERPGAITFYAGPDPVEAATVEELLPKVTRVLELALVPPGPGGAGWWPLKASNLLRKYFKERPTGPLTRLFTGKAYSIATGLVTLPLRWVFPSLPRDCVAASRAAWREDWTKADLPPELTRQIEDGLLEHFAWANHLSIRYAVRYRSTFFWIYCLAVLAVAAAVAGHLGTVQADEIRGIRAAAECDQEEKATTMQCVAFGHELKVEKGAAREWGHAELAILALILLLFLRGTLGKVHEKWVDYRSLAERIRHLTFLIPLGATSPAIRVPVPAQHADPSSTWLNWLFRAVVRQAGLVNARVDPEYLTHCRSLLVENVLRGQASYHQRVGERLGTLHRRLHWFTFALFFAALLVSLLHYAHVHWTDREHLPFALAVLLPTLGAAIHGFLSQGDFENVALRADNAHRQLSRLGDEVSDLYFATPAQRQEMARVTRRERLAGLSGEALRDLARRSVDDRLDSREEPALALAVPDLEERRREWSAAVDRLSEEELRALLEQGPLRDFPPGASAELGRYAQLAADIMGDELIGWRADSQVRPLVLA